MRLYRIVPERYLSVTDGLGASYKSGGRWNRPGKPVIYFATTPSVAMLEMANYLPSPRLVPKMYRLGIYEAPDDTMEVWSIAELPGDWSEFPYPTSTQSLGTAWLHQREALMLFVPSSAVAGGMENIAMVNPLHPRAAEICLIDSITSIYNPRTFRGL